MNSVSSRERNDRKMKLFKNQVQKIGGAYQQSLGPFRFLGHVISVVN